MSRQARPPASAAPGPRTARPRWLRGAARACNVATATLLTRALARVVALAAVLAWAGQAGAQLRVRVEVPYGVSVGVAASHGATTSEAAFVTGVRLDVEAQLAPLTATLRLDPTLTALDGAAAALAAAAGTPSPRWEPGLREAFVLLREGPLDVSAGIERLPLETARLSVPFQVDGTAPDGQREGLLGARVSLYLDPWRARAAVLERAGSVGGAFSLRADLGRAQIEGHAVYLDRLAVGAGASGTVADVVLYGEGWLLTDPWRGRGALGASGYLGDALWTAEAAFAPPSGAAAAAAAPQLLGQLSVPAGDAASVQLFAGAALTDSLLTPGARILSGQAAVTWITGDPDVQLELGGNVTSGELGTHLGLTVRLTTYAAF